MVASENRRVTDRGCGRDMLRQTVPSSLRASSNRECRSPTTDSRVGLHRTFSDSVKTDRIRRISCSLHSSSQTPII